MRATQRYCLPNTFDTRANKRCVSYLSLLIQSQKRRTLASLQDAADPSTVLLQRTYFIFVILKHSRKDRVVHHVIIDAFSIMISGARRTIVLYFIDWIPRTSLREDPLDDNYKHRLIFQSEIHRDSLRIALLI